MAFACLSGTYADWWTFDPLNIGNNLFSGLERLLLIPNVRVFYAMKSWLSIYGGFYSELDTLNFSRSRATLESGVAMRFK